MFYCDPDSRYCYADFPDDDYDDPQDPRPLDMTIDTNNVKEAPEATTLTPADVPLREGPPTREELLVYYPSRFTWTQLKAFVNSG